MDNRPFIMHREVFSFSYKKVTIVLVNREPGRPVNIDGLNFSLVFRCFLTSGIILEGEKHKNLKKNFSLYK